MGLQLESTGVILLLSADSLLHHWFHSIIGYLPCMQAVVSAIPEAVRSLLSLHLVGRA